jgi:streptogrisin C
MRHHCVRGAFANHKTFVGTIIAVAATAAAAIAVAGTGASPVDSGSPTSLAATAQHEVTSDQEARPLLKQEQGTAHVVASLRRDLGAAYAGAWLDKQTGELTVAATDLSAEARVRSAGARLKVVKNSFANLSSMKATIDHLAASGPAESVTSWHADPATNSVVITAKRDAAAEAFIKRATDAGVLVHPIWSADAPKPFADIVGGRPFQVGRAGCSVGFAVTGANGARQFVTAGHCSAAGGQVVIEGQRVGRVATSTFGREGDFALVDVTDQNSRITPFVEGRRGRVKLTGSDEAPVGADVCRSGATTGVTCGRILALDMTVNYGNGDIVRGMTATDACAEPGDSGGPFFSGTEAQGITSGGSGDCERGGVSFFQPVNEVLQTQRVKLVTG